MTAPVKPDINVRVAQYVKLRDLIREKDAAYKKAMEPYRELLDKLNAVLLRHLNAINAESVNTLSGTAYKTEQRSASIADGSAFMEYVVNNQAWDLLDKRANVTACFDFSTEQKVPPPGVNLRSTFIVGVRRS